METFAIGETILKINYDTKISVNLSKNREVALQSDNEEMSLASLAGDDRNLFASSAQMTSQSLWVLQDTMSTSDVYGQMTNAFDYAQAVVFAQGLSEFRASLWSTGFKVVHAHPDIERLYTKFSEEQNLNSLTVEGMNHLSVCNNACLTWRVKTTGVLEYARFYRPDLTRLDPIRFSLWCKPSAQFANMVSKATKEELNKYIRPFGNDSAVKAWVEAVKPSSSKPSPYPGYVQLLDDGTKTARDHWVIFTGSGGNTQTEYSPVTMKSIFLDLELVKLLFDGDWSTAWMIKNMIVLVQQGESITSGPLAGLRRNYPTGADLQALKTEFQKAGKAQIVYGNHTIKISFNSPDAKTFSPEKYSAVLQRICWFFGIGSYMMLGGSEGSSFATASWNVQAIRTRAKTMRELYASYFIKFLTHESIKSVVFKGVSEVTDYCVESVKDNVVKLNKHFAGLAKENIGSVEYSTDGFVSNKQPFNVVDVSIQQGTVTTMRPLPTDANNENTRLVIPIKSALSLYGSPVVKFDNRVIMDDKVALQQLQMLINQGPISNLSVLNELGFEFDKEVNQKKIEWSLWKNLVPIFEPRQGIITALVAQLQNLVADTDQQDNTDPNVKSGNPDGAGTDQESTAIEPDSNPRVS